MYHNQKYKRRRRDRPALLEHYRGRTAKQVEHVLGPTWERFIRKSVSAFVNEQRNAGSLFSSSLEQLTFMVMDVAKKSALPEAGPQCEVRIVRAHLVHDTLQYDVQFVHPAPLTTYFTSVPKSDEQEALEA